MTLTALTPLLSVTVPDAPEPPPPLNATLAKV